MKIFVVNAGSSSLKYQLIDMENEQVLAKGLCERIGVSGAISHKAADGRVYEAETAMPTHSEAFEAVVRAMKEYGIGYGAINHPVDRDPVCGYNGIIGDVCPRCGRREGEGVPLSKLMELKKKYHDVPDYSALNH